MNLVDIDGESAIGDRRLQLGLEVGSRLLSHSFPSNLGTFKLLRPHLCSSFSAIEFIRFSTPMNSSLHSKSHLQSFGLADNARTVPGRHPVQSTVPAAALVVRKTARR